MDTSVNPADILHKNDFVTLEITDFGKNGEGIGRTDGFPVFASGAVIGDTVRAKITKVRQNMAYARTEEVIKPSSDRVMPECASAGKCGGCQLMHYAYPAQTAWKERRVREQLVRIGGFDEAFVNSVTEEIIADENPLRCRNKALYPAGRDENGNTVFGFYALHSHRIIPVEDCITGAEENKKILRLVGESMELADVEPYNESDHSGHVRHVLIRKAPSNGKIMVCIVVNAEKALSRFRDVLITQLAQMDKIASACFHFNTNPGNAVLCGTTEYFYGAHYLEDELCGLKFRMGAESFYQVNSAMAEKLYETAAEFAELKGSENIWDLYCGIGTISLMLADRLQKAAEANGLKKPGRVCGVEIVPEAAANAEQNAKLNEITNAEFRCGDAEKIISDADFPQPDIIVLDPPRKGCDASLLENIIRISPQRIVYVSCDPATLARDLKILSEEGFKLKAVKPVDMFPHTTHVEVVVMLARAEGEAGAL